MSRLVRITDVAPRDGLQNEPRPVSTDDKAKLVELLCGARLDEVEVTSFVSPKWVPQLADADDLVARVRTLGDRLEQPPVFSVLAPNEKGFERALSVHQSGLPLKLALFTAASETFNQRNTNASIAESVERFRPIIPRAIDAGMPIRLYVSCVVACPFEGSIAPAQVARVVDRLRTLFASDDDWRRVDLNLGETIGVAHPADVAALLGEFDEHTIRHTTLHLHDTQGRAGDCVRAALQLGVRSFDGSVAGLGGCPFAGTRNHPAPGNISTHALIHAVESEGFTHGIDRVKLDAAAAHAATLTSRELAPHADPRS